MSRPWRFVTQAKALLNRSILSEASQQSTASAPSIGKCSEAGQAAASCPGHSPFSKHADFEPTRQVRIHALQPYHRLWASINSFASVVQTLTKIVLARGVGAGCGAILGCVAASSKIPEVDLTEVLPGMCWFKL